MRQAVLILSLSACGGYAHIALQPRSVQILSAPAAVATDNELKAYVTDVVAQARSTLRASEVLKLLQQHRASTQRAKWGVVGLSAVTTALGTIGSSQSTKRDWITYSTLGVGGLSTILIAIRDDADIAKRIVACQTIAVDGSTAIDTFNDSWLLLVIDAPAAGTPSRATFVTQLKTDATKLATTIDGMMALCY